MSLLEKLKKTSTVKEADILNQSKFFTKKGMVPTSVPNINIALSGMVDGGMAAGVLVLAGPSRHFKTSFALLMAKAYLDKYPDAVCLFYDSEFGAPQAYFESFGLDTERILHTPITNIEVLKFDLMQQLDGLQENDRVIVVIDSLGNLASKKEVEDALDGKSVADMTRAKAIKSLFRMVTPLLTLKDIPLVIVNHTYKEQGLFPKDIVSGGTGVMLSADNVWIIGRQQEKEGTEVVGYKFIINIEKSRFVKEKSKVPIEVSFDGGISKWSGLMDLALESGHVTKPKQGWYQKDGEEKNYRLKDTYTSDFWMPILKDKTFRDYIEKKYRLAHGSMLEDLSSEDIDEEIKNASEV